ncbi:MAG: aminomethyltransferase family protein [Planctomycetota bacterium JB042]
MPLRSPFHDRTSALCESHRWKDWSGYLAVCHYGPCHTPEYFAYRHACGLLDVTPLFKYLVTGRDAGRFLSFVLTRDVDRLRVGRVAYVTWCDERGRLLDDGTVTRLDGDRYRLTAAEPSFAWLDRHSRGFDVAIADVGREVCALALQGPTSRAVLAAATDADLERLPFFGHVRADLDGNPVELTRTGYTGDLGYEIWMENDRALPVWDALTAHGRDHGLVPAGLDALDMTRVEAGFVLAGVDYTSAKDCLADHQASTPDELDLGWTVRLDRDPFVGQDAIRAERAAGSRFAFVGLDVDWVELEERFAALGLPPDVPPSAWRDPRPVYADAAGRRQVGRATSGTFSPTLKRNLALATVESRYAAPGTRLRIEATVEYERCTVTATVAPRPFFDPPRKRA